MEKTSQEAGRMERIPEEHSNNPSETSSVDTAELSRMVGSRSDSTVTAFSTDQSEEVEVDKGKRKTVTLALEEDLSSIMGDFAPLRVEHRYPEDVSVTDDFLEVENKSFKSFAMESVAESESIVVVEEPVKQEEPDFDRNIYYELYDLYKKKLNAETLKNNFLHWKMADYYKRRRMYHVLLSEPGSGNRYNLTLDRFDSFCEESTKKEAELEGEVRRLRNKCKAKREEAKQTFDKLKKMEFDYSKEIENVATNMSKEAAEKLVNRYIHRQEVETADLSKMRLAYIKLKNQFNETQETLDAMDHLGPNLHLMDYEQLKSDNRNLQDKLEEKIMELTTTRKSCQNAMQILAHNREKVNALHDDVVALKDRLESTTDEFLEVREQVHYLKREKARFRKGLEKLREEVGMLASPAMMRDMEKSAKEIKTLGSLLEEFKEDVERTSSLVRKFRRRSSPSVLEAPKKVFKPSKISYSVMLDESLIGV